MNELNPYRADLAESMRLFKAARKLALEGDRIGADDCLERGLAILDRVEAAAMQERGE